VWAVVALLAFSGFAAGQTMPGKLVDAGGYRVHLYCTGAGSPAVIIAGAGFSFHWSLVQTEVAKFTRVCTYDPAGTAWSDPGPGPSCTNRVNEIHNLLTNRVADVAVKGPYILVGLSVGALVTRLYASLHPADVAGMVIVDHAFIDIDPGAKPVPAIPTDAADSPPALIEMTPIIVTAEDDPGFGNLPEEVKKLHRWAASLNPALPSLETARECIAQVEAARSPRANMPLAVVSTGNESPGYAPLQARLLAMSSNSQQFIAERSFHSIEMSQPDIVVKAIRYLVEAVNQ
jgi:pimeloyl-ACP methyl ester carboxylesterase